MMLGACDRRVPLDDGKRYLEALRKRTDAPPARLIVFPQDAHALDKPQTEYEQWLTALWWLDTYVKA
jgi:acylaminoacyl-peptidase